MRFPTPLLKGILIKRYNRFLADITLETGEVITAHCPNTGSMAGLLDAGNPVYLSHSKDPKRKLAHTLEMIEVHGTLVGVNTQTPNKLARHLFEAKHFEELALYDTIHHEVKINSETRLDFALTASSLPTCYVEVKNVHMSKERTAYFPDAVTTRGHRHLRELIALTQAGNRAVMLYIIQRNDIEAFDFADFIDPTYATLAREGMAAGVEVIAQAFTLTPDAITPCKRVEIVKTGNKSPIF